MEVYAGTFPAASVVQGLTAASWAPHGKINGCCKSSSLNVCQDFLVFLEPEHFMYHLQIGSMALQQTRATPAAEIKGDQAELNQQKSYFSFVQTNLNHTTELSDGTLTTLTKYFSANLHPESIPLLVTETHHPPHCRMNRPPHFHPSIPRAV